MTEKDTMTKNKVRSWDHMLDPTKCADELNHTKYVGRKGTQDNKGSNWGTEKCTCT